MELQLRALLLHPRQRRSVCCVGNAPRRVDIAAVCMHTMEHEASEGTTPRSSGSRDAQSLGQAAASVLGAGDGSGEGLGRVEEAELLRKWAQAAGCIVQDRDWYSLEPVSNATAEHEVKYRAGDHRAVKRTWPSMFGFVPKYIDGVWRPCAATALEYLQRQQIQNELFEDEIRLEGLMISEGLSMIIGQPPGGISFVISQPWVDAIHPHQPHPSETEIAAFLRSLGFTPLFGALFGWIHDEAGVVMLDAKPDNFIRTVAGILPIDVLLARTCY